MCCLSQAERLKAASAAKDEARRIQREQQQAALEAERIQHEAEEAQQRQQQEAAAAAWAQKEKEREEREHQAKISAMNPAQRRIYFERLEQEKRDKEVRSHETARTLLMLHLHLQ